MLGDSFAFVVDGPEEIAKATRICIREGADNIKINISVDDFVPAAKGGMTVMRESEVRAAVEVAHSFGKRVNSHSRSSDSVKRALTCGVDVIYHYECADEEALDLLEANTHRVFVGPAIGLIYNTPHEAEAFGITRQAAHDLGMHRVIEQSQRSYAEMRKRGIPVISGGDYGFAWSHKEPMRATSRISSISSATAPARRCNVPRASAAPSWASPTSSASSRRVISLVASDPLKDVTILQHEANLAVIMQEGRLDKDTTATLRRRAVAAE